MSGRGEATISLGQRLLAGSSDLPGNRGHPGGRRDGEQPDSLLGLAPDGVCRAPLVTLGAVSSYLAFSPFPGNRVRHKGLRVGSRTSEVGRKRIRWMRRPLPSYVFLPTSYSSFSFLLYALMPGGLFSVTLSVTTGLRRWCPCYSQGIMLYGVRTFLIPIRIGTRLPGLRRYWISELHPVMQCGRGGRCRCWQAGPLRCSPRGARAGSRPGTASTRVSLSLCGNTL